MMTEEHRKAREEDQASRAAAWHDVLVARLPDWLENLDCIMVSSRICEQDSLQVRYIEGPHIRKKIADIICDWPNGVGEPRFTVPISRALDALSVDVRHDIAFGFDMPRTVNIPTYFGPPLKRDNTPC